MKTSDIFGYFIHKWKLLSKNKIQLILRGEKPRGRIILPWKLSHQVKKVNNIP